MSLNLPDPNKVPGDPQHTQDTNLIIEGINTLKSQVDNIPAGPQGPQGEPGTPGANGQAATISVASTVTTGPGTNAQVVESGTPQNKALTFYIPRGETGLTGAPGSQGPIGPQGDPGTPGAPGAGLKTGGLTGQVLQKNSNTDFDTVWAFPANAPVNSVDGRQGDVTLNDLYDAAGAAAAAELNAENYTDGVAAATLSAAEDYADSLAPNYDSAGSAAAAQAAAEAYADGLAPNYDSAGSAAAAQAAAEGYADSLAVNYDAAGSAAAAQAAAEGYADSLAVNYDAAGSAAAAQAAAEGYADSLAVNYDAAGSAAAVAGDLSTHELATTSVHGISDTADLVYDSDSRLTDDRYPTAHAASHELNGDDEIEIDPTQVTGTAVVDDDARLVTFVTSTTRPSPGTEGQIIYETDTDLYFGFNGSNWVAVGGGAKGGGTNQVFYENETNVTSNYTISTGFNAMSAGPITVDSGVTVTIPSGSVWSVV